jgi:hypothetical protein
MQELKLFEVDKKLDGGSTFPFGILAQDHNGDIGKYVVKCFTKKSVLENYSVAKEILVSELAKSFDLATPEYAIINLDNEALSQIYDSDRISMLEEGYKFCSKFAEPAYTIFSNIVTPGFLRDYDVENIFAFDVVILNVDRGGMRGKPNLLINDKELLLIDHELTFPFIDNSTATPNYFNYIRIYNYKVHILQKHLKAVRNKTGMFDEFIENIRAFNPNGFTKIFEELDKYNISYGEKKKFLDYFAWIKENTVFIQKSLKSMVE